MSDAAKQYQKLHAAYDALVVAGLDDSPEADSLCERMDPFWWQMTAEEQQQYRKNRQAQLACQQLTQQGQEMNMGYDEPSNLATVIARMIMVAAAKRGRLLAGNPALTSVPRDALQGYLWHAYGEWAEDHAFLLDHAEVILPALGQLLHQEKPCPPRSVPGA